MPINCEQVLVNSVLSNSYPAPSKLLQIGETGEGAELAFCKWGKKGEEQQPLSWEVFAGIWGVLSPGAGKARELPSPPRLYSCIPDPLYIFTASFTHFSMIFPWRCTSSGVLRTIPFPSPPKSPAFP